MMYCVSFMEVLLFRFLSLLILLNFSVSSLYAGSGTADAEVERIPSQYAVYQQQGPTCPHISWTNLEKVRQMRERGSGRLTFQDEDFVTKIHSYAVFLPKIRSLDRIYEDLRSSGGAYAQYETQLREEGIRSEARFARNGAAVDKIDTLPTSKARRAYFSPYNIKVDDEPGRMLRWLPILQNPMDENLYYYSYSSGATYPLENSSVTASTAANDGGVYLWKFDFGNLDNTKRVKCHFTDDMFREMGIDGQELSTYIQNGRDFLGSSNAYFLKASIDDTRHKECFYDAGTFQHMLFAAGLNKDNTPFDDADDSLPAQASREFRRALAANPTNPWGKINKEDLFEFHLANIFKENPELKERALHAVNYYNDPWKYYQESFDLFDSVGPGKKSLSQKQDFMPGEDQMLAYFFAGELRFLSVASISMDALVSVQELDDELGRGVVRTMRALSWLPGVPSHKKVVKAATERKYGGGKDKYSFLDTWTAIKKVFKDTVIDPLGKVDFVTFYSHGCVISFDEDLVDQQAHEFKDVAKTLGFETWDSTYDGLNPFYRRPGTQADRLTFEDGKAEIR